MITVNRLRGFMICSPKPAKVRVLVDGDWQELKTNNRSYQKLAETVEAMNGEQLQCLSEDGTVLRAMRLDDADAQRAPAPAIPAVLANDPHAAMLSLFGSELARAYQYATEIAFSKMVECFDRVNDRSAGIEQRLERAEAHARRLSQDQIDLAYERAEEMAEQAGQGGNDAFVTNMAQAWLSGQMNAGPRPAAPRPTNGKAPNGSKGGAA